LCFEDGFGCKGFDCNCFGWLAGSATLLEPKSKWTQTRTISRAITAIDDGACVFDVSAL